ncbi:hypothetical protein L7F22_043367 [Adiantum nelumboides]|nr:hypothetical protein [Adiantum nelumboides]
MTGKQKKTFVNTLTQPDRIPPPIIKPTGWESYLLQEMKKLQNELSLVKQELQKKEEHIANLQTKVQELTTKQTTMEEFPPKVEEDQSTAKGIPTPLNTRDNMAPIDKREVEEMIAKAVTQAKKEADKALNAEVRKMAEKIKKMEKERKQLEEQITGLKEEVNVLKGEWAASKDTKEEGEIHEADKEAIKEEITKKITKAMEFKMKATKEGWVDVVRKQITKEVKEKKRHEETLWMHATLEEKKMREARKNLHCCFVDFTKAFDTIPRAGLWQRMEHIRVPIHLRMAMARLYQQVRCRLKTHAGLSREFGSNMGVKQGCPLSPTLFGTN